jgi:regulator of sigma E protease
MSLAGPLAILGFVAVLIVLVIVHELGHLIAAKKCGMRAERFSVFFGRPLWSTRRGETEYAVGWIPLGGYVKITGMVRGEDVPPEVEPRAYYNQSTSKKLITIFAGPAVNIVLAFILFCAVFWIGIPTAQTTDRVGGVASDSPAAQIGLEPGDRIVAVQGEPVPDAEALRDALEARPGQETAVTYVDADGARVTGTAVLDSATVDGREVGRLGFTFDLEEGPTLRYGPLAGVQEGADQTWFVIAETGRVIGSAFVDSEARGQVNSVVGIGAVSTQLSGVAQWLQFAALISLALGIFNLLPILPLDGGHIAVALIERVRGKPLGRAFIERVSMVGFALLMLVFVFALSNDASLIGDIRNGTAP